MAESLRMSLREPLPPPTIDAIWQRIEARRGSPTRRGVLVPALAAAGVLTLVAWIAWTPRSADHTADARTALHWTGGSLEAVEAAVSTPERNLALSDGTSIRLAAGTRLVPRMSTPDRFEVALERGEAHFAVKPQGGRAFAVLVGPVRVEVVGTRFSVAREAETVAVSVEHGTVRVHGPAPASKAMLLGAGETWSWSPAPEGAPIAPPLAVEPAPVPAEVSPGTSSRPGSAGWRNEARAGRFGEAYRLLGPSGFEREVKTAPDAATLLDLADVARGAGRPRDAANALGRLLARHRSDGRAPLAALTLGRLQLDALGNVREAVNTLELALALDLPASLEEDALARLVEACSRAGDATKAGAHASTYRARFPAGRWRASVDGWSPPP